MGRESLRLVLVLRCIVREGELGGGSNFYTVFWSDR